MGRFFVFGFLGFLVFGDVFFGDVVFGDVGSQSAFLITPPIPQRWFLGTLVLKVHFS